MSWISGTIGDLVTLQRGYDLPDADRKPGTVPVIGSAGPNGFHDQSLAVGPGVTIGRSGGSIGKVTFVPEDFWPHNACLFVIDFHGNDPRFISYLLSTIDLAQLNSGAAQPSLNRNFVYGVRLRYPSRSVQQRIASILSAYDELIENNRRRMALLEEAARQLYREWFVRLRFPGHEHTPLTNGLPKGWARKPVPEIIEVNPRTPLTDAAEHWWVEMSSLQTNSMVIEEARLRTGRSGSKFRNGDTLLARITPCLENGKTGYVSFLPENQPGIGSTEFIVLRSRSVTPEFVYCLSRTYEFREHAIKSMVGSSGRQRVQDSCFDEFLVNVPADMLLKQFSDFAAPVFRQIDVLHRQNQKLRAARDLLLPRLMSGEIAV